MHQEQLGQEIQLIQEMIEKTKTSAASSWKYFSVWGMLIIAGILGNYVLSWLSLYNWIWANWFVFMAAGLVYVFVFQKKEERSRGAKTYAQTAIGYVSMACGMSFALAGFVFPILDLYPVGTIPVIISMIVGILLLSIGGIFEWGLLKWAALLWWLGGIGMIFIHWHYRALVCIPLIIFGYLVPSYLLHRQYNSEKAHEKA